MKTYQLNKEQFIPISLDEAWDFFSRPKNLEKITPSHLGFNVLTPADELDTMYAGQIINYTVKPLLGIPLKWTTEITHVEAPYYFVDEQRFGPYSFWHHKHFFKEVDGGVLMTDLVHYLPPFGILGKMVHPLIVRPKLEEIFNHRVKAVEEKFGAAIKKH